MSYSRQTTHYGIPLPEETDLVNGLDWNTSSELIDSAVYEASEAAGSAATDIVAIKATLVNLHDADVQFQQDLNGVAGRVSTLEQNATLDEEAIQDIADMITDKEVAQAQSDVPVSEGEWFRYNGVLYVATTAIAIGDTIIPNTNCRATNIEDEMPSGGGAVAGDTRYDIVSGKMQYYDGTTWVDVPMGGGSMVPDLNKPVSITSGQAVDRECIVYAGIKGDHSVAYGDISVQGANDTTPHKLIATVVDGCANTTVVLQIGDVITCTGADSSLSAFEPLA